MIVFCGGTSRTRSTPQFKIAARLLGRRGLDLRSIGSFSEPEKLEQHLRDDAGQGSPGLIGTAVLTPTALGLLQRHQAKAVYCLRDLRDVAASAMHAAACDWPTLKTQRILDQAIAAEGEWHAQATTLFQRHEDFFADLPAAIARLARHLELELQPGELEAIVSEFGNADPAGKPPAATDNFQLPGRWLTTLDPQAAADVTTTFADWLNAHGYPLVAVPGATANGDELCAVPHVGWLEFERGDAVMTGLREGDFEYLEQAFLVRVLRAGDTFIDCGAHAGLYARLCAPLVCPGGKVHAIEPAPSSLPRLARNLADQPPDSYAIHALALGNSDSQVRFTSGSEGRSAYNHVATENETEPAADVAQLTLPSFVQRLGRKHIEFIKIDAEGRELAILQAAESLLAAGAIQVLMIEFNQENLSRYAGSCQALAALLGKHGYGLYALDGTQFRLVPAKPTEQQEYANFFAVKHPDWLQQRFAGASPEACKKSDDIARRGAQVSALKARLLGNLAHQDRYISILNEERDRLNATVRTKEQSQTELQQHIDTLTSQLKQSVADSQKIVDAITAQLDRTVRDNQKAIDALTTQLDHTVRDNQQVIDGLRLQIAQTVERSEIHLQQLKTQLARLAETSQGQTEHIANQKNELDRLAALTESQGKDITHYVKVIYEQTAYIKHLEAQQPEKQT